MITTINEWKKINEAVGLNEEMKKASEAILKIILELKNDLYMGQYRKLVLSLGNLRNLSIHQIDFKKDRGNYYNQGEKEITITNSLKSNMISLSTSFKSVNVPQNIFNIQFSTASINRNELAFHSKDEKGIHTIFLKLINDQDKMLSSLVHEMTHFIQSANNKKFDRFFNSNTQQVDTISDDKLKQDMLDFNHLIYLSTIHEIDARVAQLNLELTKKNRILPIKDFNEFLKSTPMWRDRNLVNDMKIIKKLESDDDYAKKFVSLWNYLHESNDDLLYSKPNGFIGKIKHFFTKKNRFESDFGEMNKSSNESVSKFIDKWKKIFQTAVIRYDKKYGKVSSLMKDDESYDIKKRVQDKKKFALQKSKLLPIGTNVLAHENGKWYPAIIKKHTDDLDYIIDIEGKEYEWPSGEIKKAKK